MEILVKSKKLNQTDDEFMHEAEQEMLSKYGTKIQDKTAFLKIALEKQYEEEIGKRFIIGFIVFFVTYILGVISGIATC